MRTKLQGAIIAVPKERLAINAQEFFRLLDRNPFVLFGHDLSKSRMRIYFTALAAAVKDLYFSLRLDSSHKRVGSN